MDNTLTPSVAETTQKLSHLAQHELLDCKDILHQIFILKHSELSGFDESEMKSLSILAAALPKPDQLHHFLLAFKSHLQPIIFSAMPLKHQLHSFLELPFMPSLKTSFQALSYEQKHELLSTVFQKQPEHYELLVSWYNKAEKKELELDLKNNLLVQQKFSQETDHLLSLLQEPKQSKEDMIEEFKRIKSKYELGDLTCFLELFIQAFTKLEIPLKKSIDFNIYLKFFYGLQSFFPLIPSLEKTCAPLIDFMCTTFIQFPSPEWVVKVLNQLPITCIHLVLKHLNASEQPLEKHHKYKDLVDKIKHNLYHCESKNVRMALNQL